MIDDFKNAIYGRLVPKKDIKKLLEILEEIKKLISPQEKIFKEIIKNTKKNMRDWGGLSGLKPTPPSDINQIRSKSQPEYYAFSQSGYDDLETYLSVLNRVEKLIKKSKSKKIRENNVLNLIALIQEKGVPSRENEKGKLTHFRLAAKTSRRTHPGFETVYNNGILFMETVRGPMADKYSDLINKLDLFVKEIDFKYY